MVCWNFVYGLPVRYASSDSLDFLSIKDIDTTYSLDVIS